MQGLKGWLSGRISATASLAKEQPLLFVCVVAALAMLSPYVVFFVASMARNPTLEQLKQLLFLWQTQTAGAMALLAAFIGASAVFRQIHHARQIEEEKRTARAVALRALVLPALAEIASYAQRSFSWLQRTRAMPRGEIPSLPTNPPSMPDQGHFRSLIELIEVSHPGHVRPMSLLLQLLQIHNGRVALWYDGLMSGSQSIVTAPQYDSSSIDAIELYARSEAMIIYARSDGGAPPTAITIQDVARCFHFMPERRGGAAHIEAEIRNRAEVPDWPEQ